MKKKPTIVILSYFFAPDRRVGALRASYWKRHLPSKLDCELHVITANEQAEGPGVHYVTPSKSPVLSKVVQDAGVLWKSNLKVFFENNPQLRPDLVLFTGGPFMHFGLGDWLKKRYLCRIILDYRDPFALNPGFKNSVVKVLVKKYFERKFNRKADALITVNSHCAKIIQGFYDKPHAIIQNGYDESVPVDFGKPNLGSKMQIVYTGKFYFSPTPLIQALKGTEHTLHYCGQDSSQLITGPVKNYGLVEYEKAMHIISVSDLCVIQTYGEDFQSTTKLFDYIRCKRPILIISGKHIARGSIHEELKDYPNVFWCKNETASIREKLAQIANHSYVEPDSNFCSQFSREKQLDKLVELIKNLL